MVRMAFEPDDEEISPLAEWQARVSPFLLADDPHQRCIGRAFEQETSVREVCTCVHAPCDKECCR